MPLKTFLPLLAIAAVTFYFLMLAYRRRCRTEPPPMRQDHAVSSQHELRQSMEHLVIELEELSREVSGKIDTKMHTLEVLIRQADERIQALDDLLAAGSTPSQPLPSKYKEIYSLADSGVGLDEIAGKTGMPAGEVELILSLRRFRRNPAGNAPPP